MFRDLLSSKQIPLFCLVRFQINNRGNHHHQDREANKTTNKNLPNIIKKFPNNPVSFLGLNTFSLSFQSKLLEK